MHPKLAVAVAVLVSILAGVPAHAQQAAPAAPDKAQVCAACHGADGNSTDPQYPVLAGQTARYIYLELKDFNEGRRKDPVMSPMAASLSREDMQALSQYYAALKPKRTAFKPDPAKVEAGRKKADEVLCAMCHLGGFSGQNEIPRVAGQHYAYIVKQLQDFKARRRTNDAGNMTSVASTLSDADIDNLGHFITNLE